MARQKEQPAVSAEETLHTAQQTLIGMESGMKIPLISVRHFSQRLKEQPQPITEKDPFLRDALVRIPPALLFGLLSALASGLLLPDINTASAIALSIGIIFAVWVLSLRYSLRQMWSAVLWISGPLFSYLLTEILIGNIRFNPFLLYLSDMQSFLNLFWYYLVAALLFAVTGLFHLSAGIAAILGWLWGNLNAYVFLFRGRILFPADIHAFRTAVLLTTDYNWTPTLLQVISSGWLLVFLVSLKLTTQTRHTPADSGNRSDDRGDGRKRAFKQRINKPLSNKNFKKTSLLIRGTIAAAGALSMYMFFATPLVTTLGVHPSQWFTQQNGVLLNFMINLKNSQVTKPSTYPSVVLSMKNESMQSQAAIPPSSLPEENPPNIIVVMNEAFSDLGVLGNIKTNADPLSYFHGQTKNTVKGKAYSSVIGGNTANSEYEFLTGNTMAFLPAGMVSYQSYTSPGDYSLTGQLNTYGYKTIAMHPYESAGWNRVQVYQHFGFSEVFFIDDYQNKQYVRNYVSDRSNYLELIRRFDAFQAKDKETPLFMMNITMQNHGSYQQTWDRLSHRIHIAEDGYTMSSDVDGINAEANQYLSLIKESDNAYKMLIEHFEKEVEPTIILFFGDHQPKLSDDFYKCVFGKVPEKFSVAETQKMYTVPFALWANYDIPEAQDVEISLNYLSSLLLEYADLPLTKYQEFLSEMHEVVPVINSMGLCGEDGVFVSSESELTKKEKDYVTQYRSYQYNGIFDKKNRVDGFFQAPIVK